MRHKSCGALQRGLDAIVVVRAVLDRIAVALNEQHQQFKCLPRICRQHQGLDRIQNVVPALADLGAISMTIVDDDSNS